MAAAMIVNASPRLRRPRTRALCAALACALFGFAAIPPATAAATSTTKTKSTTNGLSSILKLPIPASARVHGTSTTPATPAPATGTTSTAKSPTTTPPATPTATVPATPVPPSSTAPTATTPTVSVPGAAHPGGSTTVVGVARRASPGKTRLSTAAFALAALAALLILGCAIWALARWLALEPRWTASLNHSLREAGYRASATWAEFTDWARLGH
jgi:hypothetical protein